jgi:hypothetical protein
VFSRTLLALLIPFCNFECLEVPKWLDELHSKLWGREDLFHEVFRAVDLTKEDFVKLQSSLHHLNPSRNCKSNILAAKKEILETKLKFLRSRTTTHPLTIDTDSLVPKIIFQHHIPARAIDSEGQGGEDSGEYSEDDDDDDQFYILKDANVLAYGSTPVLPCTIRYMDLTCLSLQHLKRVPEVLLIRDEWDAVIDIFNERERGISGGAILTGQPGIGKRHYNRESAFATNSSLKARRPFCTTSSSFALSTRSRLSSRTLPTMFTLLILKCNSSWVP